MAPIKKPGRKEALKKIYQQRIKEAIETPDPLALINHANCYTHESTRFTVNFLRSLDDQTFRWVMDLTKKNMEDLYNQCNWGWNQNQKEKEMKDEKALFLIAVNCTNQEPVGFSHFRFDWDEDGINGVVYCYELQIDPNHQSKGLGYFLVGLLEALAFRFKLTKVMLTCLKHNQQAINFYLNKCKFIIDPSSPSKFNEDQCYEILSRKINFNI